MKNRFGFDRKKYGLRNNPKHYQAQLRVAEILERAGWRGVEIEKEYPGIKVWDGPNGYRNYCADVYAQRTTATGIEEIIVEVDGEYHLHKKQQGKHHIRDSAFKEHFGIITTRFEKSDINGRIIPASGKYFRLTDEQILDQIQFSLFSSRCDEFAYSRKSIKNFRRNTGTVEFTTATDRLINNAPGGRR